MNESAAAIKHRKPVKVGKLIVTLLTLFSLVGIASTPASATWDPDNPAWTFTVTVSGEEPVEDCVPNYGVATWGPDETLYITGNEFSWTAPGPVEFEAYLNFAQGTDSCGLDGGPTPNGLVTASITLDEELELTTLDCQGVDGSPACQAYNLFPGSGPVSGEVSVKSGTTAEGGPYEGTLTVIWVAD
jgi:hypothetical protein